ncbi:MAG TPA: hypothetical protein VNP72_10830 [Longimicrobium sp.]|nr:hypothetical protein [Longimicrobium sp.]
MPSYTIKNIPVPLFNAFRDLAATNRRSFNSEILVSMEQRLRQAEATSRPLTIEELRAFRESLNVSPLTPELLEEAISEGRP